MRVCIVVFLLATLALNIQGECPGLEDIQDMYDDNTFMCARFYYGWGHDLGVRGCNGCSVQNYADIPHGLDMDAGNGRQYPMGSIMVKPGCTLYVFHDNNFGGKYDRYDGPSIISKVDSGDGSEGDYCANGNPSFQCRCGMKPVSCVPEDSFAVVLRCDATGAIDPVGCDYIKKIGTKWSNEMSESISVSATIEYELGVDLFELFSEKIGVSMTTGYNWKHTSSETKSVTEEFKVLADAPPGLLLTIEQAVGHCGDTEARTELFRIRHTDAKGNIVYETFA